MRLKVTFGLLALSSLAIFPVSGLVPSSAAQEQDKSSDVRTLTGCLEKGDSAREYKLVADDGSTWELKSSKVNMGRHVGHTVTITGAVSHPEAHGMKEKAKGEVSDEAKEHGHLTVTNLKMDSESCKKP